MLSLDSENSTRLVHSEHRVCRMPHDVCGVTVESAQGWESWRLTATDGDCHVIVMSMS